ncbi:hypothetical protein VUR80DRAFT_3077 [Thermomyces stellatus]
MSNFGGSPLTNLQPQGGPCQQQTCHSKPHRVVSRHFAALRDPGIHRPTPQTGARGPTSATGAPAPRPLINPPLDHTGCWCPVCLGFSLSAMQRCPIARQRIF